jgi:UDPglucose--hexose-1-phosphate uridylyltransferase
MSERRYDWLNNRWVLIAGGRGQRPDDFAKCKAAPKEADANCPFCLGNEHTTPPEIYRVGSSDSAWQVRVIPNRFPAVHPAWRNDSRARSKAQPDGLAHRWAADSNDHRYLEIAEEDALFVSGRDHPSLENSTTFFRSEIATGYHEVIVETPNHCESYVDFSLSAIESVLRAYRRRLIDLRSRDDIQSVSIFKNSGPAAGASLQHQHSQLVAMQFTPTMIALAAERATLFQQHYSECYFCERMRAEIGDGARLLLVSEHFVVYCPFASRFAGTILMVPRVHQHSFGDSSREVRKEAALLIRSLTRVLQLVHPGADFNLMLNESPKFDAAPEAWHWTIEMFMRVAQPAGFEWNTGTFINSMSPEYVAEVARPMLQAELLSSGYQSNRASSQSEQFSVSHRVTDRTR